MSRRAAPPSLWSGNDRLRVGQRLRASLAGLQELEVLRQRHGEGVRGVLGGTPTDQGDGTLEDLQGESAWPRLGVQGDLQGGSTSPDPEDLPKGSSSQGWGPRGQKPPEPAGQKDGAFNSAKLDRSQSEDILGRREKPCVSYCSSDALDTDCATKWAAEAAVNAAFGFGIGRPAENGLGSRLRLGSSSVLTDHLLFGKRLIVTTELGLTTEDPRESMDTDSRPSSGFYEISEMDSCSLSTSCTSVYSEGPPESCWSMDSLCHLPAFCEGRSSRPHSTDEAAVRLMDLRLQKLMASSQPASSQRMGSQRPVSTGDLEFLPMLGDHCASIQPALPLQLLQYKCDLVSRNTSEIYHYPSPLHAVALQSPLFTSSPSQEDVSEATDHLPAAAGGDRPFSPRGPRPFSEELRRCRLERYISKLVLQHKCRSASCSTAQSRSEMGLFSGHQKSQSLSSVYSAHQHSSAPAGAQLMRSGSGWKIRRRISTCSHLRSPDGSGSSRDAQVLDGQRSRDSVISFDAGSLSSSIVDVSKAGEPSAGLHPEQRAISREKRVEHGTTLEDLEELASPEPIRRLVLVPQTPATLTDNLYVGKHATRELVKAAESGSEKSWLSPKEIFRRLSMRKKPSARVTGSTRCASEMNVSAVTVSFRCPEALYKCDSQQSLSADGRPGSWKANGNTKQKWTSVLEISTSRISENPMRPHAELCQGPRCLAFSTDCPRQLCCNGSSQADLRPLLKGGYHFCGGSSLSEVEVASLNGDWSHRRHQWAGAPRHISATLDSADPPGNNGKLRRARSFKELKRIVCKSMNPFHPRGSSR